VRHNGWLDALGFRHSLLEVPIAALKMTQKLDDPASIRNAVRDNAFKTIVGPVDFKTGPLPNTSLTPLVAGQWRKGTKWPLEIVIVENSLAPEIPVNAEPQPMPYA
jgi:branched-chain amino acid transport system substrate-binding protein